MERRLGLVAVLIESRNTQNVSRLNEILVKFHTLIIARQGLPVRHRQLHLISLVVEGTSDEIGALAGQLGRLPGISVKSVLTSWKGDDDGDICAGDEPPGII